MACTKCGKNKAAQLAALSKASGLTLNEMGPFPDHAPAVESAGDTVESSSDEQ